MKNKKLLITLILSYFFIAFFGIANAESVYEIKADKLISGLEQKYKNKEIINKKLNILIEKLSELRGKLIKSKKFIGGNKELIDILFLKIREKIDSNTTDNTQKLENNINMEIEKLSNDFENSDISNNYNTIIEGIKINSDNAINNIKKSIKKDISLNKIAKKHEEIKNLLDEYKNKIKKEKNKDKINTLIEDSKKITLLKTYSASSDDISIENDILKNTIKDNTKKKNALKALIDGFNENKNNYKIFIKTSEYYDLVKTKIVNFESQAIIKEYFENNGYYIYKIIIPNNSILKKELIPDINTGIIPDNFLGYEIIKPSYIKKDSVNLSGEDIKITWGVNKFNLSSYFDLIKYKPRIKIGVMDTGIDSNHEDLKDNISKTIPGFNIFDGSSNAFDDRGHGTHVAGTIGASINNKGIIGVNPYAEIISLKMFGFQEYASNYDSLDLIDYAVKNGIKVINMSFGGEGGDKNDDVYCSAIKNAYLNYGVISVVSAGNDNINYNLKFPAYCDYTITVSAVDSNLNPADFSNYGEGLEVAAPGVYVYSSVPDGNYDYYDGTSMSAPHITGLVSIMLLGNPNLTFEQISSYFNKNGISINNNKDNNYYGKFPDTKKILDEIFNLSSDPISCSSGTHEENGTCVSDVKSCYITNGNGEQKWNGSTWGDCLVTSCYSGYVSNSDKTACKLANVSQNNLDVFIMPYCPYGQAAIKQLPSLLKQFEKDNISFDIHYFALKNGDGFEAKDFTSTFGIKDIEEDIRQLCIKKYYGINKLIDYSQIRYLDINNGYEDAIKSIGGDISKITSCTISKEGGTLLAEDIKIRMNSGWEGGSPTWVTNGDAIDGIEGKDIADKFCNYNKDKGYIGCNSDVLSCTSGTHEENGTCVSDVKSCYITNGNGEQKWNGSSWGSCLVTSCNYGYVSNSSGTACELAKISCSSGTHEENGSCVSDVKSCYITNGNGEQKWNGTAWGSCLVTSCNYGYSKNFSNTMCIKDSPKHRIKKCKEVYSNSILNTDYITVDYIENDYDFEYTNIYSENHQNNKCTFKCKNGYNWNGSTCSAGPKDRPTSGYHTATKTSVTWNWGSVNGATRYEWSTDRSTWYPVGLNRSFTEDGLYCGTYQYAGVRACNDVGCTPYTELIKSTSNCR